MEHNPDPVQQGDDGKWYWCDETWSEKYGPYDTREEAKIDCSEYCKRLFAEEDSGEE